MPNTMSIPFYPSPGIDRIVIYSRPLPPIKLSNYGIYPYQLPHPLFDPSLTSTPTKFKPSNGIPKNQQYYYQDHGMVLSESSILEHPTVE